MESETLVIELEGRYKGLRAKLQADPDFGFFAAVKTGDPEAIAAELAGVLIQWNLTPQREHEDGSVDPITAADVKRAKFGAVLSLIRQYDRAFQSLPKE
jgi:hypothetical protein